MQRKSNTRMSSNDEAGPNEAPGSAKKLILEGTLGEPVTVFC